LRDANNALGVFLPREAYNRANALQVSIGEKISAPWLQTGPQRRKCRGTDAGPENQ
jgi:hypothetical protein